jgi:hypothetical protein
LVGIELITYSGPADRDRVSGRPCDVGFTHLTYDVSDLDGFVAEAAEFGLVPLGGTITSTDGPNKGARAIYLRDSDGISMELIQPARYAAAPATPGDQSSF